MSRIKVWFIQNILAPYRIPLFEKLAEDTNIDFTLILHARSEPHRGNDWSVKDVNNYPFHIRFVHSIKIRKQTYDPFIYFSYDYFVKLLLYQPDVIVCTGFSPATIQSYLYCKLFNKKYIIWNEGTEHTERNIGDLRLRLRRFLAKNASAFVIAGKLSGEYINKILRGHGPYFLSYNCNDTSLIRSKLKPAEKRSDGGNLLYTGSLVKSKGVWELIQALALLQKRGNDIHAYIIGNGGERKAMEEYAEGKRLRNLEFLGFLPFEKSLKYWNRADVLLQLCRMDYNPLVLTEALAAGMPVVCSKYVGSHPDFVHPGKNGYVVDPFKPGEVVDAIEKCLEGNQDGSMSRYALKLSEQLTYDNAAQGFIDAIYFASRD